MLDAFSVAFLSQFSFTYRSRSHCVKIVYIWNYSVQMRENMDQNNSEYGHFSRSVQSYFFSLKHETLAFIFQKTMRH